MKFRNPFDKLATGPQPVGLPNTLNSAKQPGCTTATPYLRGFNAQRWLDQLAAYHLAHNIDELNRTTKRLVERGLSTALAEKTAFQLLNEQETSKLTDLNRAKTNLQIAQVGLNTCRETQTRQEANVRRLLREARLEELAVEVTPKAIEDLIVRTIENRFPPIEVEIKKKNNGWALNLVKGLLLVVAGLFVGLTGGQILHVLSMRDLREWDLKPTVVMAFVAGQAFVSGITWCCTELTRLWFNLQYESKQQERSLSRAEVTAITAAIAVMILLIIVELTVEAYGLRGLYTEWSAMIKQRKVAVDDIPLALYYCFGVIVSFPLIVLTISGTWRSIGEKKVADQQQAANREQEERRRTACRREIELLRKHNLILSAKEAAQEAVNHRQGRLVPAQATVNRLRNEVGELETPSFVDADLLEKIRTKQAELEELEQELAATLAVGQDFEPDPSGSPTLRVWNNNP